jgi:molybdopterin synthase sulfur carrier subunit
VTLLYFSWVRQKIGRSEDVMALPPGVGDVKGLVAHLQSLGPNYRQGLDDSGRLRVAVNQRHAGFETALAEDDEVAFFPPITGG